MFAKINNEIIELGTERDYVFKSSDKLEFLIDNGNVHPNHELGLCEVLEPLDEDDFYISRNDFILVNNMFFVPVRSLFIQLGYFNSADKASIIRKKSIEDVLADFANI